MTQKNQKINSYGNRKKKNIFAFKLSSDLSKLEATQTKYHPKIHQNDSDAYHQLCMEDSTERTKNYKPNGLNLKDIDNIQNSWLLKGIIVKIASASLRLYKYHKKKGLIIGIRENF